MLEAGFGEAYQVGPVDLIAIFVLIALALYAAVALYRHFR